MTGQQFAYGAAVFKEEEGWLGLFTRHEQMGCWRNGTRIVKTMAEPGDTHPIGAKGTVLGSVYVPTQGVGYFVEWDDMPRVAVGVVAAKIGKAS